MKLKNIIVSFVLVFSLLGFPTKDEAEELEINPLELTTDQQVVYFSELYGGDAKVALKVMECESGGDNSVVGDNGMSKGVYQFQKATFIRMSKAFGEELNYNSQFDQIKLATWALSKPEYQREWTAYRAIKNSGKYSFYSKQLKKHFTVRCSVA